MYNKIRKSKKVLKNSSVVIQRKIWIRPMRLVPNFEIVDDLDLALARYGVSR